MLFVICISICRMAAGKGRHCIKSVLYKEVTNYSCEVKSGLSFGFWRSPQGGSGAPLIKVVVLVADLPLQSLQNITNRLKPLVKIQYKTPNPKQVIAQDNDQKF